MTNDVVYNVDKRTERKMDADVYVRGITKYRSMAAPPSHPVPAGQVNVCIRKRPLFPYEIERGEFDVLTCHSSGDANGSTVVVHKCGQELKPMRGVVKVVDNVGFPCTEAFGAAATNEAVYRAAGKPLLRVAAAGGTATCLMFGQTGSGKTHTMSAIQHAVARDIFATSDQTNSTGPPAVPVSVVYFELLGKRCFDLLEDGRREVFLREAADGEVHVRGVPAHEVCSADELTSAMDAALGRRETASTAVNATSSRSHAVCRIFFGGDGATTGSLTLVDLAGSERRTESMYHTAERRRECAEINTSLMVLKDCIRQRSAAAKSQTRVHVPFRGSNLTKILKDCLTNPEAHTTVIATASPGASDLEHTLDTLEAVSSVLGTESLITSCVAEVEEAKHQPIALPTEWTREQLREWLADKVDDLDTLPSALTGRQFARYGVPQVTALVCSGDRDKGQKLHAAFRKALKDAKEQEAARRKELKELASQRKKVKSAFALCVAPARPMQMAEC
jgi:kinesin family protein 2/24|mmetsp:Transcript_11830/g.21611  ORF Transcript_11830/g.21611 Transcript_11830/m.21611 type:complete len:506 (+) Transcript_11830:37-1554(+)|eukprot:CAMPEP_0174286786 /NCGR_PEP_ID=MMETSP0809-20121228/13000_1 /TAXON_ID=73025 ORGANISM="Eutreptiella gymnastica-like, Strain CCMP1594" /NCGR_SAMPLE_ID=MMETSP0809 /ASSEMBLY_ACC=CAM_ASM_000658 /LENGTH=505 /DNA_ID=CAMNT_0015382985 /DNA_START=37 /DNA_END=1554 /DNA_ORIENTATION=+